MSAAVAVAIHLAPELRPEFALRTLKSCEAALGAEQCRLTDESTSDDDFYATVTSEHDDGAAHIVLSRRGGTAPTAERDLSFSPEDPPGDRWASVGVVIAALVTAASGRPPEPVPAPPKPSPKPVHLAPAPSPSAYSVRVDFLAQLARETSTSYPAELGGLLRISFAPARSSFFVRVAGGYSGRLAPQPEVGIGSGVLGAGFRWGRPAARWGVEVHAEALGERWILSASEPSRSDSKGVWRFGGAAGADCTWGFLPELQAVVGASAQVLAPDVDVDVRGQNAERVPLVGATLVLGLRLVL
ncbi:MAG TPA: hypothetical protein VHC69_22305 [Polyangiaceae bacterium]|nr:hypothetical protein [Polyangiaceae bacterium]